MKNKEKILFYPQPKNKGRIKLVENMYKHILLGIYLFICLFVGRWRGVDGGRRGWRERESESQVSSRFRVEPNVGSFP